MNPLLNPEDVSEILRRPIRSIYDLVKKGELPAVRDGRLFKFREQDVLEYIETRLTKKSLLSEGRQHKQPARPSGTKSGGDL